MDLYGLFLQLQLLVYLSKMLAFGFINADERKCKYTRVDRMVKVRCFDMNLKEVPQYLKTSMEVLDLSYNRIRKLKRNSFERYTSIKYLLLYENMIQTIEPGTFEHLTDLQEIDLSNNGLTTIPAEVLQLPSLRNLYVDSNELINLERELELLKKPIRAPLEYLNIADCGLQDLPDLGVLPKLWHINASSNPLTELSIERFANWCQLKSIDLTKTFLDNCACQQINNHLRAIDAKTKFVPVCLETLSIDMCPLPFNQTINTSTFQNCKIKVTVAELRSRWILAGICCLAAITLLLITWYCIHKKRKSRKKRQKSSLESPRKRIKIDNDKPLSSDLIRYHESQNHAYNKNETLLHCDSA